MQYLFFYAASMLSLVLLREFRQVTTLSQFLVADRKVEGPLASFSIAASWIWAPAIFISSKVGYEYGYAGLLWFSLPNMLALCIFAPVACLVRKKIPRGTSYIQYLRARGLLKFARIQLALQLIMQVVIFAIQLSAGARMLHVITGSSYTSLVVGMAITPLLYTSFSGLKTSLFTDFCQYILIALGVAALLLWFPLKTTSQNLDSIFLDIFQAPNHSPFEWQLLIGFGIPSALGLTVAIFADHQQWQRAFAIREDKIMRTYFTAALLHGLVTIGLGSLGYLISKSQFIPQDSEMVGIEFVKRNYSNAFIIIYIFMALGALVSTLDSALSAFSSLSITECMKKTGSIANGRAAMIVLTTLATILSLFGFSLVTLWFLAGLIRLSSFCPTISSILSKRFSETGGLFAISFGLLFGAPIFSYGIYHGANDLRLIGMLTTMMTSMAMLFVCMQPKEAIYRCEEPDEKLFDELPLRAVE